jgi:hypothetical protein
VTAREVLDGIKTQLATATPGPWKANKDGTIDGTNYAEVICRGQVDCMAYCYGGTSVIEGDNLTADAEFIAAAPSTVARLTAAVEDALALAEAAATGGFVDELELADAIRLAIHNALEEKP